MKKVFFFLLAMQSVFADPPVLQGRYQVKDYSHLYEMKGFGENLLNIHLKLYEGYVKNANDLLAQIRSVDPKSYEYGALKRRVGWEFDGMRLHELYFDNLGGNGKIDPKSPLYLALVAQFGSFDLWKKDFVATGTIRGIGWSVLYLDPIDGRLVNVWINEHDVGHLVRGTPILIMDVFEHAYMPQFGLDKLAYIEVFFNNLDWETIASRYTSSTVHSVDFGKGN